MKKKFFALLASLTVVLSAVILFTVMSTNSNAASLPRDCNTNSIIYCGATSPAELKEFYAQNKTGDLPAIYSHYGISSAMINNVSDANMGTINKDGTVVLDGRVVATDARTLGRLANDNPSVATVINGKTYYEHVPATAFLSNSIEAYIFLDKDGNFIGGIMTSCGNAFRATPKLLPPPPPAPVYKCDSLAATEISRQDYKFVGAASAANGASVISYSYNFGDGHTVTTGASTTHTYATPGTYKVTLTANINVNGKTVATPAVAACQTTVVVAPAPSATCVALNAEIVQGKTNDFAYNLTYKTANGATLQTVDYNFGDGESQLAVLPSAINAVTHTYATAGTYTTTATLHFSTGAVVSQASCATTITISPETCAINASILKTNPLCTACTIPGETQYPVGPECVAPPVTPPTVTPPTPTTPATTTPTPTELPHTGPSDVIMGGLGISSIIGSAYYWVASRRSLITTLLNR